MSNKEFLAYYGWDLLCQSPFEIRHSDGSFASGQAAYAMARELEEDYKREVLQKPIELRFGVDNFYDPVAIKYKDEGTFLDYAKTAHWLIRCAESAIESSYAELSPRRIEMERLGLSLRKQLKDQLSEEQCEELKL